MKNRITPARICEFSIISFCVFLFVVGIEKFPIVIWDESRNATNAYEMYKNGFSIVPTFDHQPDMWNTKPPLLIWIQYVLLHIFGIREITFRLPSIIAGISTTVFLFCLLKKNTGNRWIGLLSALILASSYGFNSNHIARTGDYDALLVLWTTLAAFRYFYYLENHKRKDILLFFLFLSLAVLTKSVAGLFILPGLMIYTLCKKQTMALLRDKNMYLGLFVFIFLVAGYYITREMVNPGYLNTVYQNELSGRFSQTIEQHQHSFFFYLDMMQKHYLWLYYVPLGLLGFFVLKGRLLRILTLCSILLITQFLIISTAATKLHWYDAPLYPMMSVIISLGLYAAYTLVTSKLQLNQQYVLPLIILGVAYYPCNKIFHKNYKNTTSVNENDDISFYIRDGIDGEYDINNTYLLQPAYQPQVMIYVYKAQEAGYQISETSPEHVRAGMRIITQNPEVVQWLNEDCDYDIISHRNSVIQAVIKEIRNPLSLQY